MSDTYGAGNNVNVLGANASGDLMDKYAAAIARIESSGRYDLQGPATRTGDRAYGKYQVMGANVGPWTKEVLGQELTPQQFLANPRAQDAVFRSKFGQYVSHYGNPQDAASAWFTGGPRSTGSARSDVLGTTGAKYVDMFNAALGQPSNMLANTAAAKSAQGVAQVLGQGNDAGALSALALLQPKQPAPATLAQTSFVPSPMRALQGAPLQPVVDFTKASGPVAYPEFKVGQPLSIIDAQGNQRTLHPVNYNPFEAMASNYPQENVG